VNVLGIHTYRTVCNYVSGACSFTISVSNLLANYNNNERLCCDRTFLSLYSAYLSYFLTNGKIMVPKCQCPVRVCLYSKLSYSSSVVPQSVSGLDRHLLLFHPPAGTASGFVNIYFFSGVGFLTPRPTPKMWDQASVFIAPGDRVAQL
jgi:hypothetical protein